MKHSHMCLCQNHAKKAKVLENSKNLLNTSNTGINQIKVKSEPSHMKRML
jgi:hypothetical protein